MIMKLYTSSATLPTLDVPTLPNERVPNHLAYNTDFLETSYYLWLVQQWGLCSVNVIDTAEMSDEELKLVYQQAVTASIARKSKIREVFGNKVHSGFRFGKQVPALLILDDSENPLEVFPHKQKGYWETFTINMCLRQIVSRYRPDFVVGKLPDDILIEK